MTPVSGLSVYQFDALVDLWEIVGCGMSTVRCFERDYGLAAFGG